jgi:protein-S-isoprenylcysteine O-methyltransferase Ste14
MFFRRIQFYSNVVAVVSDGAPVGQPRFWSVLNTALFTIVVPGTVAVAIPRWLVGDHRQPENGILSWSGAICMGCGACIYLRCAWEFAVRGLGTPAPIAPTKFLVTTALHRYVRNPMYLGVATFILGEAALFRSLQLVLYAAVMLSIAHVFVVLYEEPTLRRQFGESYEEYFRSVPRWIPKLR